MKIAVCGLGRAGKALAHKIISDGKDELSLVINREESSTVGKDAGEVLEMYALNVPVVGVNECCSYLEERKVDVIIDFSNKETTLRMLQLLKDKDFSYVICTTNFDENQLELIRDTGACFKKGLIYAPNLTIGINLLMDFVKRLSRIVPDFDFEIVERHSKGKPRVTTTAKVIASKIDREDVPISSVRVGGYVGVHEVVAANKNERITIEHESFTREAFANGALYAARFVTDNKSGYFEMSDAVSLDMWDEK